MSPEYKVLKKITASAIYDVADKGSTCFRREFQRFLHWASDYYLIEVHQDQFYFFDEISLFALQSEFSMHPEWKEFLIMKGFIEQISEPKFYAVGDEFIFTDPFYKYRLCAVAACAVLLISKDGHSFYGSPPIVVGNPHKITKEEFELITRGNSRLFIKEENPK